MDEQKVLNCQKYYIFKIRDIVNNSFHTLEDKRMECLSQYLDLCIGTYDECRTALEPGKLKKSYEALIEGIDFQMQRHPFRKLDLYKSDFAHLHKLICLGGQQREAELHNIHRDMVCLRKKLGTADIVGCYVKCLEETSNYGEMDDLMEALVSDLLDMGYSLSYLFEWFKEQQDEFMKNGQDTSIISKLKELDREAVGYTIYIKFVIRSKTQLPLALQLLEKRFEIRGKKDVQFNEEWFGEDCYYVASREYRAMDVTQAILMAAKDFSAAKELFDMWQGTSRCIRDDQRYGWVDNGKINLIPVKEANNVKMLGYMDSYYKKQMERFLKLKDESENEDIKVLERILYTLNTAKTYKIQNRFLNFWSALEYALYPFPRFTIIEKARVVVPEAFSLFYIKNKINIFWSRLVHHLEKRNGDKELSEAFQFVDECRDDRDGGYATGKVIAIFQNQEKAEKLLECFSRHIVLAREFGEIQMLITFPRKAIDAIEDYYEGIKHDLNYI